MGISRAEHRRNAVVVSGKIRWLAVLTGGFTAVAGSLGFTWGSAIVPAILIVGAIVQPRFPRAGRLLMCAGALSLSFWVLCFGIFIFPEDPFPFTNRSGALVFNLVSVLLVALCDVALVTDEVKSRRTRRETKAEIVSVSSSTRWLVGAAGCLTAATFTFDYGLGLLSVFLIVGALVAGRFPRSGRDLMWFGGWCCKPKRASHRGLAAAAFDPRRQRPESDRGCGRLSFAE